MVKTERLNKKKNSHGVAKKIASMKEKYGDAVTLIQGNDRKSGSLTLFKPDHNRMVFWLALAGLTEYEMASVIGVSDTTLGVWKRSRPDFMAAMAAGRMEAVGTAAHSLYRVGNGYTYEEIKLIPNRVKEYHPDTGKVIKEYTEVMRVPVEKYYQPNVQALLKFLAAKYPEVWGDRSEVTYKGEVKHTIDATRLTGKQLKLLQEIAQNGVKADQKKAEDKEALEKERINLDRKPKKDKKKKAKEQE